MNTRPLIDQLAGGLAPVRVRAAAQDVAPGLAIGAAAALALVIAMLGIQPDLGSRDQAAAFAMKLGYTLPIAAVALASVLALTRPGGVGPSLAWVLVPAAALLLLAALQLAAAPSIGWPHLLIGNSWSRCPLRIAALSLPLVAGLSLVVRRQAPTDLRRAGAAIGLASGAAAAAFYALACPENGAAFVLVWYSLGLALSTLLGAALGPRLLHW